MSNSPRRKFIKSGLALSALSILPPFHGAQPLIGGLLNEQGTPTYPARLMKGDAIAIMGMAGALRDPKIVSGFKEIIENQGFVVSIGQTVNKTFGYLAGSDEDRANEFNDFVSNPLILYFRGRDTPHSTTLTSSMGDRSSRLFAIVAISTFTNRSPGK